MHTKITEAGESKKTPDLVVCVLFAFVGVIFFLPTTFFVTAHDYWMYKFRNVTTEDVDSSDRTILQTEFSPSVTISTQVANFVSSFLTIFFGYKLSVHFRVCGSLVMLIVFYVISAIFVHIDTDSWQTGFFVLTMFTVAGVNAMTTVFGVSFFSILYKFPSAYLDPFLNGQGVAALFTAFLQVLSIAVGVSTTKSALLYFWVAIGFITACLLLMLTVARYNNVYRYYNSQNNDQEEKKKMLTFHEFFNTLKAIWKSMAILLFYELALIPTHPAMTSLVVSEGKGQGQWNDVYFVPVITFFLAAACEYLGRLTAIKFKALDYIDGIWFVILSAIRVVIFPPLFMLCNIQPRSHLPVVFPHDYQYILIMAFFAFSNGYLLCTHTLIIPKIAQPGKLEDAFQVHSVGATVLLGALCFLGFISTGIL